MPTPYSYDLRKKVLDAIDDGMSKSLASKIFKISRNTINLWLARREETGDYRAKEGYQQGYGAKITDLENFREFARQQGSKTQKEMVQAWPEKISDLTIGKALKKINFTRKKKLTGIEKEMKKLGKNFCEKLS
jgi:transposase